MNAAGPRITVGVPVYRGAHLVADALSSLATQTHRDFAAIVSVDGGDAESAIVCRRFEGDRRFRVVVHGERLGWAGNINWLVDQSETEFFAYLGQDDRVHPTCYETLLQAADGHPQASVVYPDIQFLGAAGGLMSQEERHSDSVDRTIAAIDGGLWLPFLGLRRTAMTRTVDRLLVDDADSSLEDVIWVLRALRTGRLLRIPQPLYVKRVHGGSVTMGKKRWPPDRARRVWIDAWTRVLAAALRPTENEGDARRVLMAVLRRCCAYAPDLDWYYELDLLTRAERRQLASEFLSHARRHGAIDPASRGATAWDAVVRWGGRAVESALGYWGPAATDGTVRPGPSPTRFRLDGGIAAGGWHRLEDHPLHGSFRWSGPSTNSEIPVDVLLDRDYRVRVHVIFVMPGVPAERITVREDDEALPTRVSRTDQGTFVVEAMVRAPRASARAPRRLRLSLGVEATFRPVDAGASDDRRALGCAVNWIEIEPGR